MAAPDLSAALRPLGIALTDQARERCAQFLALLAKWNRTYNLTAIRAPEEMITHHLLDSLAVLPFLPAQPGTRLLDIGSGAGLPGLPLAIVRPDLSVTLLDSNAKKTAFIQQAINELGLTNATAVTARAEAFVAAQPFDAAIARAFAELSAFVGVALPHLAPGGALLAMKGVIPEAEIAALPPSVTVVATPALRVPGLDAQRHLVIMQKRETGP
jgi:16S rRNA (guanine527-N7)-methyltransferase